MTPTRKFAFSLVLTVAVLGLGEGVARLLPEPALFTVDVGLQQTSAVPGWDLTSAGAAAVGADPAEVDRYTMRSPGYRDPKGDAVRLVLAGDSCSFGYGLAWRDTIAARLARLRSGRASGREYQAASCASPGHSSLQTLVKLEDQCLAFEPDLVVIGNQFNDASLTDEPDRQRFAATFARRSYRWLRSSALLQQLAAVVEQVRGREIVDESLVGAEARLCNSGWLPPAPDQCPGVAKTLNRVSLDDYTRNLREMVRLTRANGAVPVFLVFPHRTDLGTAETQLFTPYREAMRALGEQEGVLVVDGPAAVVASGRADTDLFADMLHHKPEGARVLALAIDAALGPGSP